MCGRNGPVVHPPCQCPVSFCRLATPHRDKLNDRMFLRNYHEMSHWAFRSSLRGASFWKEYPQRLFHYQFDFKSKDGVSFVSSPSLFVGKEVEIKGNKEVDHSEDSNVNDETQVCRRRDGRRTLGRNRPPWKPELSGAVLRKVNGKRSPLCRGNWCHSLRTGKHVT